MHLKSVSIFGIFITIIGCTDNNSNKSLVVKSNDNSTIKSIQYTNPNDSSKWVIYLDSLGNPETIENQNRQGSIESIIHYGEQNKIEGIDLYTPYKKYIKSYSFYKERITEMNEYALRADSSYTINQSRYLNPNEQIIDSDGFFVNIDLQDTITHLSKSTATIEPKGTSYKGSKYLCVINGDTIRSNTTRKLLIPLDTKTKGIHIISGYLSRLDSGVYQGEKVVVERKITLDKEYYVK